MLTPEELAALGQGPGDAVQALADGALSIVVERLVASVAGADLARAIADSGSIPAIVLSALGGSADGLSARCAAEAERALERSRRVDLQVIRARNPEAFGKLNRTGGELLGLLGDYQKRCNLSMAADAQASYRAIVTDIVPRVASGLLPPERGVAEAVRRMAERGIRTVDYATGRRERPDVAMRRNLQTLVRQAANDDTESFCRRAGIRLVEVDSHQGARPSHRVWQGEVYGLDGPVEVDGVRYPGLRESGAWDGMREPNCLHSMGPFVPGQERRWSHAPDEDAGHDPKETYALLQRQRANERRIRDAKREAAELEAQGLDSTAARLRLGRAQQAQRTLMRENPRLQRRPDRERAFGADGRPVEVRALRKAQEPLAAEKFMPGKARGTKVDVVRKNVNGPRYRAKYDALDLPKRTRESAYAEARRILRDRDGRDSERLVAISRKTGKVLADSFGFEPVKGASGLDTRDIRRIEESGERAVLIHNHPNSTEPSWLDVKTVAERGWVDANVVACHDGTVYEVTCDNPEVMGAYEQVCSKIKAASRGVISEKDMRATAFDYILRANEEARWFRIRKVAPR